MEVCELSNRLGHPSHALITLLYRHMRRVAVGAVVISTASLVAVVIAIPLLYSQLQTIQTDITSEADFCKVLSFWVKSERVDIRERNRIFHYFAYISWWRLCGLSQFKFSTLFSKKKPFFLLCMNLPCIPWTFSLLLVPIVFFLNTRKQVEKIYSEDKEKYA